MLDVMFAEAEKLATARKNGVMLTLRQVSLEARKRVLPSSAVSTSQIVDHLSCEGMALNHRI